MKNYSRQVRFLYVDRGGERGGGTSIWTVYDGHLADKDAADAAHRLAHDCCSGGAVNAMRVSQLSGQSWNAASHGEGIILPMLPTCCCIRTRVHGSSTTAAARFSVINGHINAISFINLKAPLQTAHQIFLHNFREIMLLKTEMAG